MPLPLFSKLRHVCLRPVARVDGAFRWSDVLHLDSVAGCSVFKCEPHVPAWAKRLGVQSSGGASSFQVSARYECAPRPSAAVVS